MSNDKEYELASKYRGTSEGADKTQGAKRTFRKPKPGFSGKEQKELKEFIPNCVIRNPHCRWVVTGGPDLSFESMFSRVEDHYELSLVIRQARNSEEFDLIDDSGKWVMDSIDDFLVTSFLDMGEWLIAPDDWMIVGGQAFWIGEHSMMLLQPNGDGTAFFVTYSNSFFRIEKRAKPGKKICELQAYTMKHD